VAVYIALKDRNTQNDQQTLGWY